MLAKAIQSKHINMKDILPENISQIWNAKQGRARITLNNLTQFYFQVTDGIVCYNDY
jgi:hypothetical protein